METWPNIHIPLHLIPRTSKKEKYSTKGKRKTTPILKLERNGQNLHKAPQSLPGRGTLGGSK